MRDEGPQPETEVEEPGLVEQKRGPKPGAKTKEPMLQISLQRGSCGAGWMRDGGPQTETEEVEPGLVGPQLH
jgi:hypothetical protein